MPIQFHQAGNLLIVAITDPNDAIAAQIQGVMSFLKYFKGDVMAKLDDLMADVAAESSLVNSLGALIDGVREQIAALPELSAVAQEKIEDILAALDADKQELADALLENTPDQPPVELTT